MAYTWELETPTQNLILPQNAGRPVASFMPTIRKEMKGGVMGTDAISELFANRIVLFTSQFDEASCTAAQANLLYLDANVTDPDNSEIKLYVNSPGGVVTAGLALYNTMQNIQSPVSTIGMGMCASMGAFLLCTGAPGRRFAYPDTTIMIHQPSWGNQGTHSHMKAHMKFGDQLYLKMIGIMAAHCGITFEEMEAALLEDNFLTAQQALELGMIDRIIPAPTGKTVVVPRRPGEAAVKTSKARASRAVTKTPGEAAVKTTRARASRTGNKSAAS
jgi:ATP-dependent Clp protease protease subunit